MRDATVGSQVSGGGTSFRENANAHKIRPFTNQNARFADERFLVEISRVALLSGGTAGTEIFFSPLT